MSIQAFREGNFIRCVINSGSTSHTLDATNDGIGMIFRSHRSGTITKIGFNVTTSTSAPTYRIAIEGATTTRTPDGTIKTAGTSYVDAALTSTGWAWYTLGASASVSAGDQLAATVRYQSGTIGASNFVNIASTLQSNYTLFMNVYALTLTAGTWAVAGGGAYCLAVQYSDGEVVGLPWSTNATYVYNSGSSPRYRGTKWTPAVTCEVQGVMFASRVPNNADFEVLVYEGSSASPIATIAVDPDVDLSTTGNVQPLFLRFPSPLTLTGGTAYRFIVNPTTANSQTTLPLLVVPDADSLEAWGLDGFSLTTTTSVADPITWTDTANSLMWILPVLSGVDSGGTSGTAGVVGS